jgi:hypothetical protein
MNITGTLGLDSPSVILGKAERVGDNFEIQYRLWYRTLDDTNNNRGYKIVLNTSDNKEKNTNFGFIRIQRIKSTSTQSLTTTEINIIV